MTDRSIALRERRDSLLGSGMALFYDEPMHIDLIGGQGAFRQGAFRLQEMRSR